MLSWPSATEAIGGKPANTPREEDGRAEKDTFFLAGDRLRSDLQTGLPLPPSGYEGGQAAHTKILSHIQAKRQHDISSRVISRGMVLDVYLDLYFLTCTHTYTSIYIYTYSIYIYIYVGHIHVYWYVYVYAGTSAP